MPEVADGTPLCLAYELTADALHFPATTEGLRRPSWTVDTIENAHDRGFWVAWAEFRFFPKHVGRSIGFQPSLTSGTPLADGMPVRVQFVEHRGRKAIVRLEVPPGVLGCNAAGVQ